MGTALLALCFCAMSLVLALFLGVSPISDKAKVRYFIDSTYLPHKIIIFALNSL